jgi:TusA-related sulfurtransferase
MYISFCRTLKEGFYPLFQAFLSEEHFMQTKPDKTLDCLGLYCPEPVFRARMELDNMKIGEVLEVLADDPAAEADIQALAKHLEQEIISINKEAGVIRILIKKVK